jgi:XTP/dITP diphosphohydrolase
VFELVLGTHNANKVTELKLLLPADQISLISLAEIPQALDVDETGSTFVENARLKATVQAIHLRHWVLAEDSGLTVDALGGRPGVYSARYAGTHGDDGANNAKVLDELKSVPIEKRTAQFNCNLCLSDPQGNPIIETHASCAGIIAFAPSGNAGFGYDPLFVIREYHRSFAELNLDVKRAISHRSRALRQFIPEFLRFLQSHAHY